MSTVYLDMKEWRTPEEAHRLIAKALNFPAHYGKNLDALYDCLTEQDNEVVLYNTSLTPAGTDAEPFVQVFRDAGVLIKAAATEEELTETEKAEAGLGKRERTVIRPARNGDREFWQELDADLNRELFGRKVRDGEALVLTLNGRRAAVLRWDLISPGIPCCSRIAVKEAYRGRGLEEKLLRHFEDAMAEKGITHLLALSRPGEELTAFRSLGWLERGMLLPEAGEEETVLILGKTLKL